MMSSNVNEISCEKYLLVNNGIIKNICIDARQVKFCGCICNINFLLLYYAVPEIQFYLTGLTPLTGKLQVSASDRYQEISML